MASCTAGSNGSPTGSMAVTPSRRRRSSNRVCVIRTPSQHLALFVVLGRTERPVEVVQDGQELAEQSGLWPAPRRRSAPSGCGGGSSRTRPAAAAVGRRRRHARRSAPRVAAPVAARGARGVIGAADACHSASPAASSAAAPSALRTRCRPRRGLRGRLRPRPALRRCGRPRIGDDERRTVRAGVDSARRCPPPGAPRSVCVASLRSCSISAFPLPSAGARRHPGRRAPAMRHCCVTFPSMVSPSPDLTETAILRGRTVSTLGTTTSSTPFSKCASMAVGVDSLGQRDGPRERPVPPLDAVVLAFLDLLLEPPLAAERQHVVLDLETHVLRLHAGHVGLDLDRLAGLDHVDRRHPRLTTKTSVSRPRGGRAGRPRPAES